MTYAPPLGNKIFGVDVIAVKNCSVSGCKRKIEARGWCKAHYERWRRGKPVGSSQIQPSRETLGERMEKHGHTKDGAKTITYRSWRAMKSRCLNQNFPGYRYYGNCGITICARWDSFEAFLEDMGERPSIEYSLDRIDGAKGYSPENCRWATAKEQRRNQSRNRAVERDDGLRFRTIVEATEATGANRQCIRDVCIGKQKTHIGHTWRFIK